jgi:XisH protein
MAAKDLFHDAVKNALEADGWRITHDPYPISSDILQVDYEIDLGAEKTFAAEKEGKTIAVEVKTFMRGSAVYEYHGALGQYLNYRVSLDEIDANRVLYLAVPLLTFKKLFQLEGIKRSVKRYGVLLLVFDPDTQKIISWET